MARKIRKDDTVVVIAGEDKGKRGTVQRVDPKTNRIVVSGVNIIRKAQRPTRAGRGQTQTGIIEYEAPIDASNVMVVDPKTNEPTRVRFETSKDGSKVRIARKSGSEL